MTQDLKQALAPDYEAFYHAAWPAHLLQPVQTVTSMLTSMNQALDREPSDLDLWPDYLKNDIANMVRINWFFQRLPQEPIRKPILAHPEGSALVVDCGDTRLMALSLLDRPVTVSVVVTCTQGQQWPGWRRIHSNKDLIEATGFDPGAVVLMTPSSHADRALDWLEIGDASTAHHLHDMDERLAMIKTWLRTNPGFRFTRDWLKQPIDWASVLTKP